MVYEELLVEDFLNSRLTNEDRAFKYHNLLASKLMPNLNEVTVENIGDEVEMKRSIFLEALNQLNIINKTKDQDDATD